MISTVVVVENVEDVLPLVMLDDVDDGGSVQRSDKKRERHLIVRGLVCAVAVDGRRTAVRSSQAAAQRLVDGRRGVDDGKLERGGELGDDVGRRTWREAEQRQHAVTITGQLAHCTQQQRAFHPVCNEWIFQEIEVNKIYQLPKVTLAPELDGGK